MWINNFDNTKLNNLNIENLLWVILPHDFRKLLQNKTINYKMISEEKNFYPFVSDIENIWSYMYVDWLYEEAEMEDEYNMKKKSLPENFLPIWTADPGTICLAIKWKDQGKVYIWMDWLALAESELMTFKQWFVPNYWNMNIVDNNQLFTWNWEKVKDPETWEEYQERWDFNWYYNVHKIADSFEEFYSNLKNEEENKNN